MTKLIFIFIMLFSQLSFAETQPATTDVQGKINRYYGYGGACSSSGFGCGYDQYGGSTPLEMCENVGAFKGYPAPYSISGSWCKSGTINLTTVGGPYVACPSGYVSASSTTCSKNVCPSGQNWTLNGSTCSRPDCVAPQVRDPADGVCKASACTAGEATSAQGWANAWVICQKATSDCLSGPKTVPSTYCDGSCTSTVDSWSGCFPQGVGSVDSPAPLYCTYVGKKTGESCSQANLPQPTNPPVIPQKTPPCLPTEGVLTSSSGNVKCVPVGTPSAEKPVVTKKTSTENFPDGSSKVTETTTTRDPATGAESKDTKVTNTPATGGGSGQAGPVGSAGGTTEEKQVVPDSKSGSGDKGDQSSDFCAKNPNLQICKGGMGTEETQKAIKDLLDPKDPANSDSVTAEKNGYEEKATAHKQFIDAFASKGQNNEGFLSWAWIPEIPASSCVPFSGVVGGKTITLDWCNQLAMVRDIAGYMFYILTAFGLFRIFANSTGATT